MEGLNTQNRLAEKEGKKNTHQEIKDDLLSESISFASFRDKLIELDQSDSSRTKSIDNLELLKDEDVTNFIFSKNDLELEKKYKNLLSFTEFHVGQIKLSNKGEDGVVHIKEALNLAEESEADNRWINYLKGTYLYLNNQEIPEDILDGAKDMGNNSRILESFNKGLKERGYPDYLVDYKF